MDQTPYMDKFEEKVNSFLKENEGKIVVKDIKYTSDSINPHNSVWKNWTAMVVYETIE
jgi:hypothetical protein